MGPSEAPGCSRIVMVVPGGPAGTENIQRQLLKLIYVQKVAHLSRWHSRAPTNNQQPCRGPRDAAAGSCWSPAVCT